MIISQVLLQDAEFARVVRAMRNVDPSAVGPRSRNTNLVTFRDSYAQEVEFLSLATIQNVDPRRMCF